MYASQRTCTLAHPQKEALGLILAKCGILDTKSFFFPVRVSGQIIFYFDIFIIAISHSCLQVAVNAKFSKSLQYKGWIAYNNIKVNLVMSQYGNELVK